MPDKKISELPALPTPITTTDLLVVVRSGVNYKADKEDIPASGELQYLDDWDTPTT